MYEKITKNLATKLKIQDKYIVNVLNLLEEGNTIAFIARYRKELTNSLDEVAIKQIQDEFNYLKSLEERKEELYNLPVNDEVEAVKTCIDWSSQVTFREWNQKWVDLSLNSLPISKIIFSRQKVTITHSVFSRLVIKLIKSRVKLP